MTAEEQQQMICSLLTSIDGSLKKLVAIAEKRKAGDNVGKEIASDADLDGQYGDPVIRRDPKRWTGESYVGSRFSETTPEYLEEVASFKDWQAQQDDKKGDDESRKKAHWNRKDAARARGWAKRLRERPPTRRQETSEPADDFGGAGDFDDARF